MAGVTVVIAGIATPGYDPMKRTVSRLAETGLPGAYAVPLVTALVGLAFIVLAMGLVGGPTSGRLLLSAAGVGLMVAAAVRLDPASATPTAIHRLATAVAMLGMTGAPLAWGWRAYGWPSFALGVAAAALFLLGVALLPTAFSEWGAWERALLIMPMAWMVLVSARLPRNRRIEPRFSSIDGSNSCAASVSSDDTMKKAAASSSSARQYVPVSRVTSAKP